MAHIFFKYNCTKDYIKKNALQLLWCSEINKYKNNYFPRVDNTSSLTVTSKVICEVY